VVHDGYKERDIKGEKKEARLDFIDNTTDRELDRTPNLSHVLELRKVWKDKGGLVEVEDPIPTVMTEGVNKGALLNGTEIMEESVTSSIHVRRDVIQNTRETSPQKGEMYGYHLPLLTVQRVNKPSAYQCHLLLCL